MSRYRLSEQSRSDLDDIWLRVASDNVAAGDCFIDELAESLRSFPIGNHVIFHRTMQDGIEVVGVLSGL